MSRELLRLVASSGVATAADLATLLLLARAGLAPAPAAAAGALVGGAVNFALGRAWVFSSTRRAWLAPALAYFAVVVGGGAALSAVLVDGLHRGGVPLVVAKGVSAVAVLLAWTAPVSRRIFRPVDVGSRRWSRPASARRPQPSDPARTAEEAAWLRSS